MLYMYMDPCTCTLVYVYSCRFNRFYAAVLMSILSVLFIIIWPAAGGDTVCIYIHTATTHYLNLQEYLILLNIEIVIASRVL